MCNITLVRFIIACSLESVLVYSIDLQNSKTPLHLNIPANIICCGFGSIILSGSLHYIHPCTQRLKWAGTIQYDIPTPPVNMQLKPIGRLMHLLSSEFLFQCAAA